MTNCIAYHKQYWHGNTVTPQHWNLRGYTQGRGVPPDDKAIVPNNDTFDCQHHVVMKYLKSESATLIAKHIYITL